MNEEAPMSIQISEDAKVLLRSAGWHDGRHVGTADIVSFLRTCGFQIFLLAIDFLEEFHGINLPRLNGPLSFLKFDVFSAASWVEEEDLPYIGGLVSEPLCIIGHGGGVLVFITHSGRMLLLDDQWMRYRCIPTLVEGIDCILGIRPFPQYPAVQIKHDELPPRFR
jgi:SUKH-3 immunity protein